MVKRGPQKFGDIIDIRGPRGGTLEVTAPDGLELRIPATGGRAQLWLAQAGTWKIRWDADGSAGTIEVLAEDAEAPPPPEPEPEFTYMPGRR